MRGIRMPSATLTRLGISALRSPTPEALQTSVAGQSSPASHPLAGFLLAIWDSLWGPRPEHF